MRLALKRLFTVLVGIVLIHQVLFRFLRKFMQHFPALSGVRLHLDSDLRRRYQPPDQLISRSGIQPGMTVLEVGCGSGAHTPFVARAVGEGGAVYALDKSPRLIKLLERKLKREEYSDIRNVFLVESSAYELPFDDASFDAVYLVSVLQEIPDRIRALEEVKRVLKPGGVLAITEFLPDPDYPLRSTTVSLCQRCGYLLDTIEGNFFNYTVRFINPSAISSSITVG